MHELGIVYEIVRVVDDVVKENDIKKVEKIILEVGQLSMAIPRFLEECYPAAVDGTDYEDTELEIEILTAMAQCKHCGNVYAVVDENKVCPKCGTKDHYQIMSGQEFNIKEIVAH